MTLVVTVPRSQTEPKSRSHLLDQELQPQHHQTMGKEKKDLITVVFSAIDNVIELYLGSFIKPFLRWHEVFYAGLNKVLRKGLDDNATKIPSWFTANFITYFRTALVVPTLLFLAWEYWIVSAFLVLLVDFGDFLDGVVARFWVDRVDAGESKKERPSSPASSDNEFGTCN
jgi:hypothetical protein